MSISIETSVQRSHLQQGCLGPHKVLRLIPRATFLHLEGSLVVNYAGVIKAGRQTTTNDEWQWIQASLFHIITDVYFCFPLWKDTSNYRLTSFYFNEIVLLEFNDSCMLKVDR